MQLATNGDVILSHVTGDKASGTLSMLEGQLLLSLHRVHVFSSAVCFQLEVAPPTFILQTEFLQGSAQMSPSLH